jgi:GntR family transcriptional regulator
MFIRIDFESEIAIYVQLRNQIIEGIAKDELLPGESLPSVRQLAEDLGINMHTVNKAYNILKDQGFIAVHKRKGVIVSSIEDMRKHDHRDQLIEELRPIIAESYCRGLKERDISEIIKQIYMDYDGGGENE